MANEDKLQWRDSEEEYGRWANKSGVGTIEDARKYLQVMQENGWKGDGFRFYYALQTLDRNGIALDAENGIGKEFGDEDREMILNAMVRNQMSVGHFPKLLEKVLENANNKEEIISSILQRYQVDIENKTTRHGNGDIVVRYDLAGINKNGPTYEAIVYLVSQLPEEKRKSILEGFSEKDLDELGEKGLMEFMQEEYSYMPNGELTADDLKAEALKKARFTTLKQLQDDIRQAKENVTTKEEQRKAAEQARKDEIDKMGKYYGSVPGGEAR